jgi:uncharacterized protein YjiS (DUF1127 family)
MSAHQLQRGPVDRLADALNAAFGAASRRLARARKRAAARRELAQLDTVTLRDIALARCEVDSAHAEAFGAAPRTRLRLITAGEAKAS